MTARCYVPATLERLRGYVEQGALPAGPDRFMPESDQEEDEYAAGLERAVRGLPEETAYTLEWSLVVATRA